MINQDIQLSLTLASFCCLLFALAGIRHYARNSVLPAESWVLLLGLGYGLARKYFPALPALELTPELVFSLILPVLIFAAASMLPPRQLLANGIHIGILAIAGVVATLFLIAIPLHYGLEIPLIHALLLAAAVAATDPSAVVSIFQRFQLPEKLNAIIEGESLFNDATAIVAFVTIASLAPGHSEFEITDTLGRLAWALGAAILVGLLLGWCAAKLILAWSEKNSFTGLSLTLILAFSSFLVAEHLLHASGVIATMAAAWVFLAYRGVPAKGEAFHSFWSYLSELATGMLFFILGVTAGQHNFPLTWAIPGIILTVLMARVVLIYGSHLIFWAIRKPLPWPWQHILILGGLRGAVSAALVLLIPADYVYREFMLCMVLVVCLFTLVINPLFLQIYLKKSPKNLSDNTSPADLNG